MPPPRARTGIDRVKTDQHRFGSEMVRRVSAVLARAAASVLGGTGIIALALTTACYTYTPSQIGNTAVGGEVGIDVTDVGRVDLAPLLGAEVSRVEGRVKSVTDSSVMLGVTRVEFLSGSSQKWSGEPVTIARADVKAMQARSFSRSQTVLTVVLLGVGLALGLAAAVIGSGSSGNDSKGPPDPGNGT